MLYRDKNSILYFISVAFISFYSFYLSSINSFYNQDFYHWSYILHPFIDYKNKLKLLKELELTHGLGQIIFFSLVDKFKKIDLVSIGTVTAIFYSLNFIILFKIFSIVSSRIISLTLVFILFLIHPFIFLPWADYYSGLCLNLFIYIFLRYDNKKINFFVLPMLLLLAIFFRTTYLISIFLSIIIYLILNYKFFKKKQFNIIFYLFFFKLLILIFFLHYSDVFYSVFLNNFLFFKDILEVGSTPLKEKIISSYGLEFWILVKLIYRILQSFLSFIDISNSINIIFIIFFLLNLKILFNLKKGLYKNKNINTKIFFILLLGIFGFIQSIHSYEIFRHINSTIGIFVAGIYFIKYEPLIKYLKNNIVKLCFSSIILLYALGIIFNFNKTLYLLESYKFNKTEYTKLNNNFFGSKIVKKKAAEYYNELSNLLCKNNIKITNFSPDYAITHLCDYNEQSLSFYVSPVSNKERLRGKVKEAYERIFYEGKIEKNEIVITNEIIDLSKNIEIKYLKTLHTGHDLRIWNLPRLNNIYKLKD